MKLLKNIYNNQKVIFLIFVFILMFTNTILLFTEHLSFLAKIAYILIPLGIQVYLLALSKRPGKVFLFLLPKSILDAFQLVLIKLYGGSVIAVDMFINLANTSPTEAGELLGNILPTIIFLLVLYIPAIILAIRSIRMDNPIKPLFRKRAKTISVILLAIGLIALTGAKYSKAGFKIKYDLYPFNVFYNLDFAVKKYHKTMDYPNTSVNFKYNAIRKAKDTTNSEQGKQREIYAIVLGETARAANWHLYGYDRNTTPNMDTMSNIITFRDVLTQSNTTHKVVPLIFSPADASNFDLMYTSKSIVTAFKEAGFKTVFLSNQSYGKSFTYYHFQEADIQINIKDAINNSMDHEMLPHLDSVLNNTTEDLFIIIHLYGSHFNYYQRYTEEFKEFTPDNAEDISEKYIGELINSYDNSILSTDDVIAKVIGRINATNSSSAIIHLSDHGEDMLDDKRGRFLHASPIPTYYQLHVPYIVWMSEEYINSHPDKYKNTKENANTPISNNTVFHSMLDFAEIQTKYLDTTLSIGSNKLTTEPRSYLNDHDGCTKVSDIHFTKYDIEQFKNRNIELR